VTDVAAMERPPVKLPVIRAFAIEGYGLFPGEHGDGIRRDIPEGVTVVVGLNGLGKTTLLTALYRSLTGPVDSGIMPRVPLGTQKPSLRKWSAAEYFGKRVEDSAANATVELTVAFGSHSLRLKRRLSDLSLVQLHRDDVLVANAAEADYRQAVQEMADLPRFEDFLVLLLYVVFVFEERPLLMWDATAQAELFRFVVNPPSEAKRYRDAFERIANDDSERRNLRVQTNKLRKQLETARASVTADRPVRAELDALEIEVEALRGRVEESSQTLEEVDARRRDLRERFLNEQHLSNRDQLEYVQLEQRYLRSVFPSAQETAREVLANAQRGCLICGDRSGAALRRIEAQAANGRCPFCESPAPDFEPGIAPLPAVDLASLDQAATTAEARIRALGERQKEIADLSASYQRTSEELAQDLSRIRDIENELDAKRKKLPPDAEKVASMDAQLKVLEGRLAELKSSQIQAEAEFVGLIDATRRRIELLKQAIVDRFEEYASAFLEEKCELVYRSTQRTIGQEGRSFLFPGFHVSMTSALSGGVGRPRISKDHVSESQKEFIDLAFRMALVEALAAGEGAMIVLETPEASLDQVFAVRAGALFGRFAHGRGVGNRLIATSNVTEGPMIGAMLGVHPDPLEQGPASAQPHFVPPADRPGHVIDLLHLAAENAALQHHREVYESALRRAIHPELESKG